MTLTQDTRYPWDGAIKLTIEPENARQFAVFVRIPGWASNRPVPTDLYRYLDSSDEPVTVRVNGQVIACDTQQGYLQIDREWKPGDTIELNLPMPIRRVVAHPEVKDDRGLVALERGPSCTAWRA